MIKDGVMDDEGWGDGGYIKLGRSDSADDAGVCGVAKQASFPLV